MTRPLTSRGVGAPDFRKSVAVTAPIGSIGYIGRQGTLARSSYIERQGTLGRSGTVQQNMAAQDIAMGVDIQTRYMSPIRVRSQVPLGPGTAWTGSWYHVGSFAAWRFGIVSMGGGGSMAILGGMMGTNGADGRGTLYPAAQVVGTRLDILPRPGTLDLTTYVRPWFRRTGNSRGTVTVILNRQA